MATGDYVYSNAFLAILYSREPLQREYIITLAFIIDSSLTPQHVSKGITQGFPFKTRLHKVSLFLNKEMKRINICNDSVINLHPIYFILCLAIIIIIFVS